MVRDLVPKGVSELVDASFFDRVHDRRDFHSVKYGMVEKDVIPLWIADMDFQSPPAVVEALERVVRHGIYGYSEGGSDYDQAIVGWYRTRFGWDIDRASLVRVPTVLFGMAAALRAMTEPGDSVLIFQPVYHPFARVVQENGRRLVVSQLALRDGRYEMDLEDFRQKVQSQNVRLCLFCSPHNPVGRVWTYDELEAFAKVCLENGVAIVSDEIHGDFVYPGYSHIPLETVDKALSECLVTCTAPTKTFNLAGLQAANLMVPNRNLKRAIVKECSATGCNDLGLMGLTATIAAYQKGGQWLDALLEYLRGNFGLLKASLEGLPISALELEGTYLAWLDCRELGLAWEELDRLFLGRARVFLHNGRTFGAGGEGFMRINIACPRPVLREALERIGGTISS